jgi:hypothetical protein
MNARFRHRLTLGVLAGLVLAAGLAALLHR